MAVRSWSPRWSTAARLIALLQLFFGNIGGQTVSILPFNGAFVLRRPTDSNGFAGNNTRSNELYFQNGCPSSADQKISTQIAGHSYVLPVYPRVHNLYCSVNVRLAQDRVHLDRPYVDIIASRDPGWMSVAKHRLCVTVQLTNAAGASVGGSCVLNERYEPFCLIRQIVPYSWFQLQDPQPSEHLVSVSYSVKSHCAAAEIPLSNQRLRLLSTPDRFSVFALSTQPDGQLSLLTRPNLTFSTESMSTIIFHYKQSPQLNASESIEARSIRLWMWIDPRFEIVSASLLDPKKWEMKAESAADAQRHVTFTLTPTESEAMDGGETYLFAMLLRMRSEQERGGAEAKPPPNVHASIVVYWMRLDSAGYVDVSNQTESGEHFEYNGRISRRLTFGVDSPYIVVPIMKSNDLVNVAVITGLQMSTPMRILSISDGGKIRDITDQSQCVSAEPRVLKVSPTCSSVFVDGSESRGLADVFVHVQYKSLRSSAAFNVWFPRLPITVWISDRTLNSVNDWRVPGWKPMDRKRRRKRREPEDSREKREARQSVCGDRFQQAEVRILAAFQVVDELSGDITYLSGSPELLFDLTQVSMDRVQSSDPEVVSLRRRDGRLLAVGNKSGSARIVLKAATQHVDYGFGQVSVTRDRVSAVQLLIRVVTDVDLSLHPQHPLSAQYELVTQTRSQFTQQYQHGAMEIEIFYSDGERELLSDVDTHLYVLSVIMAAADAVRVRQQRGSANVVELVVLDDKLPPDARLLTAEMRGPAVCEELELPALASGQVRLDTRFNTRPSNSHSSSKTETNASPSNAATNRRTGNDRIQLNISGSSTSIDGATATVIGAQPLLALLLLVVIIFGVYHLISGHSRGLHDGYEKLVMPLLARLSSSGSLDSDSGGSGRAIAHNQTSGQLREGENTKEEWVWLSKRQLDSMSVASHFSQRSTVGISNGTTTSSASSSSASSDDSAVSGSGGTNRSVSISYRGSEISVFIAPQASVSVNEDQRLQHRSTATWRSTNGRSNRVRSTIAVSGGGRRFAPSHPMPMGSTSVHDRLDEFCGRMNGFPPLDHADPTHRHRSGASTAAISSVGLVNKMAGRRQSGGAPYRPIGVYHDVGMNAAGAPPHRVPFAKDHRAPLPSYASLVYADDGGDYEESNYGFSPPPQMSGGPAAFHPSIAHYSHHPLHPIAAHQRRLHGSVDKLGGFVNGASAGGLLPTSSRNVDYSVRETVA